MFADIKCLEDDLETIIHVTVLAWCNKFQKRKVFKKEVNKEFMFVAYDRTRC